MKRFNVDEDPEAAKRGQPVSSGESGNAVQPGAGHDQGVFPPADWPTPPTPPKVQQTLNLLVREAIETGLSLHDTCARVAAALAGHNLVLSDDDLSGWIGSYALAVT